MPGVCVCVCVCVHNVLTHLLMYMCFLLTIAPPIYYVPVLRSMDYTSPGVLDSPRTLQNLVTDESFLTGSPIIGCALAGPLPLKKV